MEKKFFKDSVREELRKEEGEIQTLEQMVGLFDRQLKKESSLSTADRQDIVQDTIVRLFERGKLGSSKPYLHKALLNQKVTHFRKQQRFSRWTTNSNDAYSFQQIHLQPNPLFATTQAHEYIALLSRYAHFLDGSLRPALRAFFRLSLSNAESLFGFLLIDLKETRVFALSASAIYQSRCRLRGRLPTLRRAFLQREGLHEDPHAAHLLLCFDGLLLATGV